MNRRTPGSCSGQVPVDWGCEWRAAETPKPPAQGARNMWGPHESREGRGQFPSEQAWGPHKAGTPAFPKATGRTWLPGSARSPHLCSGLELHHMDDVTTSTSVSHVCSCFQTGGPWRPAHPPGDFARMYSRLGGMIDLWPQCTNPLCVLQVGTRGLKSELWLPSPSLCPVPTSINRLHAGPSLWGCWDSLRPGCRDQSTLGTGEGLPARDLGLILWLVLSPPVAIRWGVGLSSTL